MLSPRSLQARTGSHYQRNFEHVDLAPGEEHR
jgi:hypothetical protein